jgi:hypothetical protein
MAMSTRPKAEIIPRTVAMSIGFPLIGRAFTRL